MNTTAITAKRFIRHSQSERILSSNLQHQTIFSSQPPSLRQKSFVPPAKAVNAIWACASLLHVSRVGIDAVLDKFSDALKLCGIMFVSFKLRDGEWEERGRYFNGYDERSFRLLMAKHPSLAVESTWVSDDVRPSRAGERWLSALLYKLG